VGVSIPQPFQSSISGSLGSVGPVTVAGIPSTFHIDIDTLPQIDLKLEPVSLDLKLEPVTMELKPIDFNLAIKEIPSVRMHLPADFSVGLSLLGMDVLCVRLCGEAQVITEPYVKNPCEHCGDVLKPAGGAVGTVALAHG
jgi:hypothetical protein